LAKNKANNPDQYRANNTDHQSGMDLGVTAERIANEGQHSKRAIQRADNINGSIGKINKQKT
jgi:hypothetical protein